MNVSAFVFLIALALINTSTVRSDKIDDAFKLIDSNGDGKLSHEEIEAVLEQIKGLGVDKATLDAVRLGYHLADLDHDGFVTLDELRKANDPEAAFKRIDQNGDGKVTFEEFKAYVEKNFPDGLPGVGSDGLRPVFDKVDTDNDGNISLEEYEKAVAGALNGQALERAIGK